MNYAIKGLLVSGILSAASLAFAMNDTKVDPNNNNNAPTDQRALTPSEYIQEQQNKLDCLLKRDPKSIFRKDTKEVLPYKRLDLILTPRGMQFLMEEIPLDLQKEITRKVLESLPIYSKIMQKIEVGYKEFTGHTNTIPSVAFSPDSNYVATGSLDKTARLWDVKTGKMMHEFTGHTNTVWSVAFSPDSKHVLMGSGDNAVRLCDVKTGKMLHVFTHTDWVSSVAFSPDSKNILTGSDAIARLWDVETGEIVQEFKGHTNAILSVAFSPDS